MADATPPGAEAPRSLAPALRIGFAAAVATAASTAVSFGLAVRAVPISGAFCPTDCIHYPYLETVSQYPTDFVWMIPAMLLVVSYLVLTVAMESVAGDTRSVYARCGRSFALVATAALLIDYWVQLSVVPVSLMSGETNGLPLIIQYNPHGVFIVLEELGYLMISLSFVFLAMALPAATRLERAIRWLFVGGFALVMLALVAISVVYGLERLDRFEVAVITIVWVVLLLNGGLLAFVFRRRLSEVASAVRQ